MTQRSPAGSGTIPELYIVPLFGRQPLFGLTFPLVSPFAHQHTGTLSWPLSTLPMGTMSSKVRTILSFLVCVFATTLRLAITHYPRHLSMNWFHRPVIQGVSHIFIHQMAERDDCSMTTLSTSSDPSSEYIQSDPSSVTTSHGSDRDREVGNVPGILYEEQREVSAQGMYLSTRVATLTGADLCHTDESRSTMILEMLSDDVLLEISDIYRKTSPDNPVWRWHTLAHVCRRW